MSQLTIDNRPTTDSVLGPRRGELALRMHGDSRDGQVLRLSGSKFSIGSSPTCTLRIEQAGLRPVHCYILRGEGGTVVRRWSADTRLNGRSFRDAMLREGDRLSVGPIDLEVLADGDDLAAPVDEDQHDQQHLEAQTAALENERASLAAQRAELEAQREELDEEIQRQQHDRNEFLAWRSQFEAKLATQNNELSHQQDVARAESETLARQREELSAGQRSLDAAGAALAEQRADFERQHTELAETRRQLSIEQQELKKARELHQQHTASAEAEPLQPAAERSFLLKERELAEVESRLAYRQAVLDQRFGELALQREIFQQQQQRRQNAAQDAATAELQARCDRLQDEVSQHQRRLQQREEELRQNAEQFEQLRLDFDAAQTSWLKQEQQLQQQLVRQSQASTKPQAELEVLRAERDAARDDLAQRSAEFERARDQWQQHRAQAEQEAEKTAQLQERAAELAQLQRDFEAAQASWLQQEQQLQQQLAEQFQASADQHHAELEALRSELDTAREGFAQREAEFQSERDAWERERAQTQRQATEDVEAVVPPVEQDHEDEEAPPISEALLALQRLREQALQNEDEEDDGDEVPASGELDEQHDGEFEADSDTQSDDEEFAPAEFAQAGGDSGDDVSIEDYMSQLLMRVQGRSESRLPKPTTTSPKKKSASKETKKDSRPTPTAEQQAGQTGEATSPKPAKPETLSARAAAPEQASSLRAMRELANQSARSALSTSSKRQWVKVLRTKLAMSAGAAICGGVLLAMADSLVSLPVATSAGSFAAAGWFGFQAMNIWRSAKRRDASPKKGS